MTILFRAACASLLVFIPFATHAEIIDATSQITTATVFSDRALVTRATKVHIPAGVNVINIANMPAGFNESSIRVQGKGGAGVKIGTVEVKHVYLTEQANTVERDKTAALEAKTDEKAFLQGEIKTLQTREGFINRIVDNGADQHDKDNTKMDFAPEKWVAALNTLQTSLSDVEKQMVMKTIAMRKLDAEISKLQEELNQIRTSQAKERRDVHINVESAQATDIDLSVTYQTGGAVWRPVYDARLDTGTGALDLEQYGQASQQTGEDWNDIDLTLSTAQPAAGSEMPRISEWWVRLFQPMQQAYAGGLATAKTAMLQAQTAMPMSAPVPAEEDAAGKDLEDKKRDDAPVEIQQASVQTTEYAADFHVPGHVSVKSVRDMSKVFIGAVHMKAELAAQVSPRLTPQAYLFAKVLNGGDYPLVSGIVSKYRDGSFIGNASLALLRPGETAHLSFGVDDRIKVTYKHVKEEQANPTMIVVGDMKIEREYQTKIENLHKDPLTITVFEQYPVAVDPDVKVELLDEVTTPGYVKDPENRQGVITWSSLFQPKEEKKMTIGFQVKYPKDSQVTGL